MFIALTLSAENSWGKLESFRHWLDLEYYKTYHLFVFSLTFLLSFMVPIGDLHILTY